MRSGVLAPVAGDLGEGGARFDIEEVGERSEDDEFEIVVLRAMFVVSAEGGGGRKFGRVAVERMEARQRKHSPVPK
jgi:hypothetical protein